MASKMVLSWFPNQASAYHCWGSDRLSVVAGDGGDEMEQGVDD